MMLMTCRLVLNICSGISWNVKALSPCEGGAEQVPPFLLDCCLLLYRTCLDLPQACDWPFASKSSSGQQQWCIGLHKQEDPEGSMLWWRRERKSTICPFIQLAHKDKSMCRVLTDVSANPMVTPGGSQAIRDTVLVLVPLNKMHGTWYH